MTAKIVLLTAVALALLTFAAASPHRRGYRDQDSDWVHHQYSVLEISTTDIVTPNVWSNLLYDLSGTELVGFDVGLCTLTPAVNNTGSLYELCTIIHYFNNGTDQVVLNGANSLTQVQPQPLAVVGGVGAFVGASGSCTVAPQTGAPNPLNAIYVCDFWTPNFQS